MFLHFPTVASGAVISRVASTAGTKLACLAVFAQFLAKRPLVCSSRARKTLVKI
jgi:hypothetical protein